MANVTKIPSKLAAVIMTKTTEGKSHTEIADWLLAEHSIKVSRMSVQRFCANRKKEHTAITNQIYTEAIARTAVSDMDVLAENMAILRSTRDKAVADEKTSDIIRSCAEIKSHVALKMNVVGDNSESSMTDEKDELLDMILKSDTDKPKTQISN